MQNKWKKNRNFFSLLIRLCHSTLTLSVSRTLMPVTPIQFNWKIFMMRWGIHFLEENIPKIVYELISKYGIYTQMIAVCIKTFVQQINSRSQSSSFKATAAEQSSTRRRKNCWSSWMLCRLLQLLYTPYYTIYRIYTTETRKAEKSYSGWILLEWMVKKKTKTKFKKK